MLHFCKIMATVPLLGIPALCTASDDIVVSMPTGMKDLEGLKFQSFRTQEFGMNFVFARKDGSWRIVVTLLNVDTPKDKRPILADVHATATSHPESINPIKRISDLSSAMGSDGETWHYFTAISPGELSAQDREWVPDPTPVLWAEGRRAGYRVQLYVADKRENASPEKLGQIAESLINAMIKSITLPKKPVMPSNDR